MKNVMYIKLADNKMTGKNIYTVHTSKLLLTIFKQKNVVEPNKFLLINNDQTKLLLRKQNFFWNKCFFNKIVCLNLIQQAYCWNKNMEQWFLKSLEFLKLEKYFRAQ